MNPDIDSGTIVALALAGFIFLLVIRGIRIVPQAQVMLIERLGRFHRVAESGLNFVVPILDAVRPFKGDGGYRRSIDLREQVMDFPPQPVITRDNVTMRVDSVIYFRIIEPRRAMYEIEDLPTAIRQLAVTNLRNIMGELDLDQTLTSRDVVNGRLQRTLDEATDVWGVKITRVELKNINPPEEIENAMSRQMKAERERRAAVTEAEGRRTAQILGAEGERDAAIAEAEGRRQAAILDAHGQAEAIIAVAKARAEAVRLEFASIHEGRATPEVISLRYVEALKHIAEGPGSKVFLPYEASALVAGIGSVVEAVQGTRAANPETRRNA
jgi:regulator of protease activity HflC (stomatin/prohibitin superfamily)